MCTCICCFSSNTKLFFRSNIFSPSLQQNPFLTTPSPAGPSPTLTASPYPGRISLHLLLDLISTNFFLVASPFLTNSPFATQQAASPFMTNPYPSLSLSMPAPTAAYSFHVPAPAPMTNAPAANPFMTNPSRASVYNPTANPFMTNPNAALVPNTIGVAPILQQQQQHVPGPFTPANTAPGTQQVPKKKPFSLSHMSL